MSDVRSDWILYKNDIRLIIIYQFNSLLKEEENKICKKMLMDGGLLFLQTSEQWFLFRA